MTPGGLRCPPAHAEFKNPALPYSVCYPAGWGFVNLEGAEPFVSIPGTNVYHLRLASPQLYPWTVGQSPAEAVAEKGGVILKLTWLTQPAVDGCTPTATTPVSGKTARWCSYTYDLDEVTVLNPEGAFTAIKLDLPFLTKPIPPHPDARVDGASLHVHALMRRTDFANLSGEVWRLLRLIKLV